MWIGLALSLGLLWVKESIALLLVFIVSILALYFGVLHPVGGVILMSLLCVAVLRQYYKNKLFVSVIAEIVLFVGAVLLFLHQLPGFENPKILDKVIAGPHSAPFSMYFNFDKALLPFVLLGALSTLLFIQRTKSHPWWHWLVLILSVPALLGVATLAGGLRIEPHFPSWIWQFALANLFFVSLAEEALFRGYIQQRLSGWIGNIWALFITAAIFGFAHFSGGILLVVFAGISGLIYGIAWLWSGRLWVSTLFHFGLNLLHLLLFTYPAYRPYIG